MKFLLLATLLCTLIGSINAQTIEKIHVHFDKDIYLPGETIWFKAYLYNEGKPSELSTNFYAAIYNENGKLLQQKHYPVFDGSSNGDFEIPADTDAKKIQFRAFTKTILVTDSSYVFQKVLSLYKKENKNIGIQSTLSNHINLQFFPEGGSSTSGVSKFIAFRAYYDDGRPATISGKIIEEPSQTFIDSFYTNAMGMGKIQFMQSAIPYVAIWNNDKGELQKTALPQVSNFGVSLHVEKANKEIYYMVNKNTDAANLQTLHLLVQNGGTEIFRADLKMKEKNSLVNKFSLDSLPTGLLQVTLFDDNWNPLQKRLVYLDALKESDLVLTTIEKNKDKKGRNKIGISLKDPLFTTLSVSIADLNFYNQPGTNGIEKNLLLSPWMNENTANAFLKTNNTAEKDLFILTHNLPGYNWQNLIAKNPKPIKPTDNYLSVSIRYKEKKYGLPSGEMAKLIVNDAVAGKQFLILTPVAQAYFQQSGLVFYDSTRLFFQLEKNKDYAAYMSLYRDDTVAIPATIAALALFYKTGNETNTVDDESELENFIDTKPSSFNDLQTIKTVVVKSGKVNPITKRISEVDDKYSTGMFRGLARGYQFVVMDDPDASFYTDIVSYITYRVPELTRKSTVTGLQLVNRRSNEQSLIYIDESELPAEAIGTIPMSQVAYLKYIPGIVIGASGASTNGALYVYTKKGDDDNNFTSNMRSGKVAGYNQPKDFSGPDYSDKTALTKTDLRTTLYWNPYLLMDKANNQYTIEYFNNDVSKKLLLTIEGFNEDGKLIHIEKIIE